MDAESFMILFIAGTHSAVPQLARSEGTKAKLNEARRGGRQIRAGAALVHVNSLYDSNRFFTVSLPLASTHLAVYSSINCHPTDT
jgi:hypothetical protein